MPMYHYACDPETGRVTFYEVVELKLKATTGDYHTAWTTPDQICLSSASAIAAVERNLTNAVDEASRKLDEFHEKLKVKSSCLLSTASSTTTPPTP